MERQYGYIYVRYHESYEKYNACKLGKAINIIERDSVYTTGEIKRGFFPFVIRVNKNSEDTIERLLQNEFITYHIYVDGGVEFYDKKIINLIMPYLSKLNIWYEQLTDTELLEITRENRIQISQNIIANEQQIEVLNKCYDFYKKNDIGKLIWSCGLGKTLLSILIVKEFNFQKVIIGVPSIFLQKQFMLEILKIFPNSRNILCVGGDCECSTTDELKIKTFMKSKTLNPLFVITTYNSCYLLLEYNFDFMIGDEAHHLVGINSETHNYKLFHNISKCKALFMTATEKNIGTKINQTIYSMNDKELFGEYLDVKSVCWAIDHHKITDYELLILSNTETELNIIIHQLNITDINKDLFMATFMTLKSIEQYNDLTHVLVCCNKTESADKISEYINIILSKNIVNIDQKNIYYNSLHSNKKINLDPNDKNSDIVKFKNAQFGIIASVYIFGEGFDLPKLNGVVFAENMFSDIRIVQTALRPNRLNKEFPNKIARIIIPYLDCNDINSDNESFNRVRMIVAKMRNIDEHIEQKMKIAKINISHKTNKKIKWNNVNFIDNAYVLNIIKLRLIHSKALNMHGTSAGQIEYEYIKYLNRELHILSKEEYVNGKTKEQHKNYIDNPEEYFRLKGVWQNWYDFLCIDTSKYLQTKNEWIKFCRKYIINTSHDYELLCEKYECLPKNPDEFYKGFINIKNELGIINKRR